MGQISDPKGGQSTLIGTFGASSLSDVELRRIEEAVRQEVWHNPNGGKGTRLILPSRDL